MNIYSMVRVEFMNFEITKVAVCALFSSFSVHFSPCSTPNSWSINDKNCIVGNLNIDVSLGTKGSRTAWEDAFMNTYLNPVLSVSFYVTCSNKISFVARLLCDKSARFPTITDSQQSLVISFSFSHS